MNYSEKCSKLLDKLNQGLVEKEEPMRLALLAALSGESIFFLGLPGTAKSMVARRLQNAFAGDAKWFEYLMNEFSNPDEVFGPVSIEDLKRGEYRRNTKGKLPEADVAFLDEIWKAGPAILNTLLTILNEKKFHNGTSSADNPEDLVPLKVLVAASNEYPVRGRGLEALWDRFVLRVKVDSVGGWDSFMNMVESPDEIFVSVENELKFTARELEEISRESQNIKLPQEIKVIIGSIRRRLFAANEEPSRTEDQMYYISDRRWKKIVKILKTSAFINGRKSVNLMDIQLLEYCLWGTDQQQKEVCQFVEDSVKEFSRESGSNLAKIQNTLSIAIDKAHEDFYVKKVYAQELLVTTHNGTEYYSILRPTALGYDNLFGNGKKVFIEKKQRYDRYGEYAVFNVDFENYGYARQLKFDAEKKEFSFYINNGSETVGFENLAAELTDKERVEYISPKQNGTMPVGKLKELMEGELEKTFVPFVDQMQQEQVNIENRIKDSEIDFSENIFASGEFCEVIQSRLQEEKDILNAIKEEYLMVIKDLYDDNTYTSIAGRVNG